MSDGREYVRQRLIEINEHAGYCSAIDNYTGKKNKGYHSKVQKFVAKQQKNLDSLEFIDKDFRAYLTVINRLFPRPYIYFIDWLGIRLAAAILAPLIGLLVCLHVIRVINLQLSLADFPVVNPTLKSWFTSRMFKIKTIIRSPVDILYIIIDKHWLGKHNPVSSSFVKKCFIYEHGAAAKSFNIMKAFYLLKNGGVDRKDLPIIKNLFETFPKLLGNKKFLMENVVFNKCLLDCMLGNKSFSEDLLKDKDFAIFLVGCEGSLIKKVDKKLWQDEDVLFAAIERDMGVSSSLHKIVNNKDIIEKLANKFDVNVFKYASSNLMNDKNIVKDLILKFGDDVFEHASDELQDNKEFILDLIVNESCGASIYKYSSDSLKMDFDLQKEILKVENGVIDFFTDNALFNHQDEVINAIAEKKHLIVCLKDKFYYSDEGKSQDFFVKLSIAIGLEETIKFLCEDKFLVKANSLLQKNKWHNFLQSYLKHNGNVITKNKNIVSREFVVNYVDRYPDIIKYTDINALTDKEFMLKIVCKEPDLLGYLLDIIDQEYALKLIKKDITYIDKIPKEICKDLSFIISVADYIGSQEGLLEKLEMSSEINAQIYHDEKKRMKNYYYKQINNYCIHLLSKYEDIKTYEYFGETVKKDSKFAKMVHLNHMNYTDKDIDIVLQKIEDIGDNFSYIYLCSHNFSVESKIKLLKKMESKLVIVDFLQYKPYGEEISYYYKLLKIMNYAVPDFVKSYNYNINNTSYGEFDLVEESSKVVDFFENYESKLIMTEALKNIKNRALSELALHYRFLPKEPAKESLYYDALYYASNIDDSKKELAQSFIKQFICPGVYSYEYNLSEEGLNVIFRVQIYMFDIIKLFSSKDKVNHAKAWDKIRFIQEEYYLSLSEEDKEAYKNHKDMQYIAYNPFYSKDSNDKQEENCIDKKSKEFLFTNVYKPTDELIYLDLGEEPEQNGNCEQGESLTLSQSSIYVKKVDRDSDSDIDKFFELAKKNQKQKW